MARLQVPWNSPGSSRRGPVAQQNWAWAVTQDGSQAYFGSKLKGTQCECFGGWGLPLSWVGEAVLALLTKQWRSGQKSELILSSKHRLSLLFFSPLYPLGLSISFKGNSYSRSQDPIA